MHKYKLHTFTALLSVLAIATLALSAVSIFDRAEAQASTGDNACSTGNHVFIDNSTTAGNTVQPGVHKVSLAVSTTLAPSVKSVLFTIDGTDNILGRGVRVNNNPYWEMQWLSQVTPSGPHSIGAAIELTTGKCHTPTIAVNVNNTTTTAGKLALSANPAIFEGLTNEPRNFVLNVGAVSGTGALDVTPWVNFRLTPIALGVVSPADGSNFFRFSAGPSAGSSVIVVVAQYGGITKQLDIPVKILAQTSGGTTSTTGGTTSTSGTASTTASASSAPTALESDTPVKQCVISKIGDARYSAITSGRERPTTKEFEAFALCFAIRNYVIPGSWAPVEAKKETIQSQPASSQIKVSEAENVTETKEGSTKQQLKFSGKAKPEAKVLIYIFSEPLVVTTSADKNGDWSYSLEDPLEPGKHEAYALVSKGDGSYERSSVFSFAVAKVEAAEANPNGLSLNLERNQPTAKLNTSSMRMYIIGIALLLVVVAGLAFIVLRIRKKKAVSDGPELPKPGTSISPTGNVPHPEPKPEADLAAPPSAPPETHPSGPAPEKPEDTDSKS
jgi:hypothetical protein